MTFNNSLVLKFLRSIISDHHPLRLLYHRVIAFVGACVYRFPSRHLKVIAVTGTGGKTTTCHLIAEILREAGYRVGLATTIGFRIHDKDFVNTTKMTTVGRFGVQKLLRQMADAGCQYAVVEVTSHALIQSRLFGVSVDSALLTNLTGDHIEYHGGFEAYRQAKAKLFEILSRSSRKHRTLKKMFLNRDDPHFRFYDDLNMEVDDKYFYGIHNLSTFMVQDVSFDQYGSHCILKIPREEVRVHLKLPGMFNVYNALAAASLAIAEGVSLDVVKRALEKVQSLPGRFEEIQEGQPFRVVVDYAHTAEALRGLLQFYRDVTKGRLFVVFGATGGGRDKGKRLYMGAAAHELADVVILTSDDPYEEDELEIIEMVAKGVPRQEGDSFLKIADRRRAIEYAIAHAREGDTVVIAGKGCEPVQMIYGERREWDDRKVVREALWVTRRMTSEVS